MIDYHSYCKIHQLHKESNRNATQIAEELGLNVKTVLKWLQQPRYQNRKNQGRSSLLDPYKGKIMGWLQRYKDYSARQVYQMAIDEGYTGGYTLVKDYLRTVRPKFQKAFLKLHFLPGESAQVDWGSWKSIEVDNTRRRLSVFSMVLCHSRMMYIEFTVSENQENFLQCHQNAFEFFGGVPQKILVDNCKTAVIENIKGEEVVYNRWYMDFASYYGFEPVACNVKSPHEKGQVENSIGYIKKNLLRGLQIPAFEHINTVGKKWMETIANERIHATTGKKPVVSFIQQEKPCLNLLPQNPYCACQIVPRRANRQFRVSFDGNTYSVPSEYANEMIELHCYASKLLFYYNGDLVSKHLRSYGKRQDFEHPEHPKALLEKKRKATYQKLYQNFIQLSPKAESFCQCMIDRNLRPTQHIRKIMALCQHYSKAEVKVALEDAWELGAFNSEYIANIIEQKRNLSEDPGPLHVPRAEDALKITTPHNNLQQYKI